jgi:hypothetical protein
MSWLSDFVRSTTGGLGVGETVGAGIGGFIGGPTGAATGAKIGGGVTEFIDLDRSEGQATARDISPNLPQESGMSGNQMYGGYGMDRLQVYPAQQAGFGLALGPSLQFARQALGRGTGGAVTGFGAGTLAGAAVDMVFDAFGNPKKLVITRKMQREVKELYMYMNGDLNAVAQAYSQYKGMSFNAATIQKILLKRFRNDGPYVTKAAIRKTRSTVRKLERLEMLKKQITGKPTTTRRRATSTTRITQVK